MSNTQHKLNQSSVETANFILNDNNILNIIYENNVDEIK